MASSSTVSNDQVAKTSTINVQNVNCVRNEIPLFRTVSFSLESGQVLQIKGPNGSGKTSLLRTLSGLSDTTDHKEALIEWCGQDITRYPTAYRQSLSYIGHQPGIKLELTVRENLETTAAIMGHTNKIDINQAIKRIGLSNHQDIPAQRLSAGQRKRVSLCRLILFNTPLWIIDEPQASLDIDGMHLLETMIEEHLQDNGLVIMTTHQQINLPDSRLQSLTLEPAIASRNS